VRAEFRIERVGNATVVVVKMIERRKRLRMARSGVGKTILRGLWLDRDEVQMGTIVKQVG